MKQSLRAGVLTVALCIGSSLAPAARACGYHDPSSISLGMLNLAYPDALHVRSAVWVAQRDGVIDRVDPAAVSPPSPEFMLLQMARLREAQAQLERLRARIEASAAKQPLPSLALVLIGPMLWTRFDQPGETVTMTVHASGPLPDDVVIVTDVSVVAALADDRLSLKAAREHGLVRFYGAPERVDLVARLLGRDAPVQGMTQSSDLSTLEAH